jgi:hypothetical protein
VVGQDKDAVEQELARLLDQADRDGEKDRKKGLRLVTKIKKGRDYRCTLCDKKGRHDRVLAHALSDHLRKKTWSCPKW